jgi:hypothetical protein
MRTLVLAIAYVLAATSASFAEGGFNPGTVVSNTYDKLEARGCDPGFGFSPPGCNYGRLAPGHVAGQPPRRGAATSNRHTGSVD